METAVYKVLRIEGDYAVLRREEDVNAEEILVARALLPQDIREGSRLLREFLEYTLL